jgi:hypothetical protein
LVSRIQNVTRGDANFPLKDGRFSRELSRARPSAIPFDPIT